MGSDIDDVPLTLPLPGTLDQAALAPVPPEIRSRIESFIAELSIEPRPEVQNRPPRTSPAPVPAEDALTHIQQEYDRFFHVERSRGNELSDLFHALEMTCMELQDELTFNNTLASAELLPLTTAFQALARSLLHTYQGKIRMQSSLEVDKPTPPPLRFRSATHADITPVVALVESAYRGEASRRGWTTEADLLDGQRTDHQGVRTLIEAPQSLIVVAERAGELIACAHIEQRNELCYFGMFSVCPELQGAGVGNAMLSECERLARESWGCRAMEMTVIRQREELIAWYERRGYRRTGESRPFPYGDERFGLPRRPDLEFIVLEKPLQAHAQKAG